MPLFQINFLKKHFLYLSPTTLYPWGQIIRPLLFGFVTPRIRNYSTPTNKKKLAWYFLLEPTKSQRKVLQKPKHIPITNLFLTKETYHRIFYLKSSLKFLNTTLLKAWNGSNFWTGRQNKYCDSSKETDFIKFLMCSIY